MTRETTGKPKETLRERRAKTELAWKRRQLSRIRKKQGDAPQLSPIAEGEEEEKASPKAETLQDAAARRAEEKQARAVQAQRERETKLKQRRIASRRFVQTTKKGQPLMRHTMQRLLDKITSRA